MTKLKNILFSITAITLFFIIAELITRLFILPGSYSYIERRLMEERVSHRKAPGEYRIFLYGESTMHGHYLYPYSTIDKWIRLYLKDLLPEKISRRVKIVNFGRIGENSKFISTAFADTIPYKPDLAAFYTAHNDFCLFGNRRQFFAHKGFGEKLEEFFKEIPKHSSFINLINRIVIRSKLKRNKDRDRIMSATESWYDEEHLPPRIDLTDLMPVNSPKFNVLNNNFQTNVNKIMDVARRHSVPVIFLEAVARFKGYEPARPMHDPGISKDRLDTWSGTCSEADEELAHQRFGAALELYNKCLALDPAYALTYYRIAECYEGLNEPAKANKFYALANENDFSPLRAPYAINAFYETIAAKNIKGVYVVRTQRLFEAGSLNGIVDESLIGDPIHPTIKGQAIIALEIVRLMYENDLLTDKSDWRWDRLQKTEDMENGLGLDEEGRFQSYLALAGYVRRNYAKTEEFLQKALTVKPGSVFARSWLAWTYWEMGKKEAAAAIYKDLAAQNPSLADRFFNKHPEIGKAVKK